MLDRRSFLTALGATLAGLDPARSATRAAPVFLSACTDPAERGAASIAAFDADGRLLFATRLPGRGHDATARPGATEFVVFARRPGNWAAVLDRATGAVRQVVTTPRDRHFFGHGAFSGDGRLLYATENRIATGEGVLGIYDADAAYARVGELPTHGLGPHDLALLPGREGRILVANGGTHTHPETGRAILNRDAMRPNLAVVDLATGDATRLADLGANLGGLSIRHLAVAADGEAAFACQWEGDPTEPPPLVGLIDRDGATRFLATPDDGLAALDNYVGSVALDASGQVVAATSPRGNTVAFWERASGRYLGRRRLPDACGIAPAPAGPGSHELFVVSSGNAGVHLAPAGERDWRRLGGATLSALAWDNHILAL